MISPFATIEAALPYLSDKEIKQKTIHLIQALAYDAEDLAGYKPGTRVLTLAEELSLLLNEQDSKVEQIKEDVEER